MEGRKRARRRKIQEELCIVNKKLHLGLLHKKTAGNYVGGLLSVIEEYRGNNLRGISVFFT